MDIDSLTDDQLDDLASKLAGRLPTGRHGDRIVTTRRQLLAAAAGGSAGVAALVRLGIDPATAQSAAGQVGTPSSPEDVFAFDLDVQNGAEFNGNDLSGVGSLSIDDGTAGGDPILGGPSGSSNPSVSFGNYQTTASPLIVEVFCLAETDGSGNADVRLQVDEDSDGIVDKEITAAFADSDLPAGSQSRESAMVYVPEGGQYRIANQNDPNASNLIVDVYENEL
jgi:hypothetical protein